MIKCFVYILLLISTHIFSQNKQRMLYGVVKDGFGVLPNIHIKNITTNFTTYSINNGSFKLLVKLKDSLKITAIGYKTKYVLVKKAHFGIKGITVNIDKELVLLDEVHVKRHNLSGSLALDVTKISKQRKIDAESLVLPNANGRVLSPIERRLYTARYSTLDWILNSISGRLKKLEKLEEIESNEQEILNLSTNLKSFILTDLSIPKDDFYRFIYFCQENNEYKEVKQKGKSAVIDFIRKCASTFKKNN